MAAVHNGFLPYIDHSPYPSCTPPLRNVWDIFYFVPRTNCYNCIDTIMLLFFKKYRRRVLSCIIQMPKQSKLSYALVVNKSCINDIQLYILYVHVYVRWFCKNTYLKITFSTKRAQWYYEYDDIDLNGFTDI